MKHHGVQAQQHRLCQQHTFRTVSSVITDWLSVITNSYWACDILSDPIRDEELLIHKRDGSSCDEQSTKRRYWTLLMADNMGSELDLSAVCVCLFVCFKEKIPDSQHCPAICTSSSAQRWSTGNHIPGRISWTPHVHNSFALLCLLVNPNNLLTQTGVDFMAGCDRKLGLSFQTWDAIRGTSAEIRIKIW